MRPTSLDRVLSVAIAAATDGLPDDPPLPTRSNRVAALFLDRQSDPAGERAVLLVGIRMRRGCRIRVVVLESVDGTWCELESSGGFEGDGPEGFRSGWTRSLLAHGTLVCFRAEPAAATISIDGRHRAVPTHGWVAGYRLGRQSPNMRMLDSAGAALAGNDPSGSWPDDGPSGWFGGTPPGSLTYTRSSCPSVA